LPLIRAISSPTTSPAIWRSSSGSNTGAVAIASGDDTRLDFFSRSSMPSSPSRQVMTAVRTRGSSRS
jgi:hypothetical protein